MYLNWLSGQQAGFQDSWLPSFGEAMAALPRLQIKDWPRPTLPPGVTATELPWGILRVGAPLAWAKTQGEGVRVAVIDTGIDPNHPDLKANLAGGYNALGGSSYADDNGHGSHVAGTIAGVLDGKGVAGVAPKAKLFAVKVLDKDGGGGLTSIIKGLIWCGKNDIQVANMSLGAPIGTIYARGVGHAQMKGVVIVALPATRAARWNPGTVRDHRGSASDIRPSADFSSGNEVGLSPRRGRRFLRAGRRLRPCDGTLHGGSRRRAGTLAVSAAPRLGRRAAFQARPAAGGSKHRARLGHDRRRVARR